MKKMIIFLISSILLLTMFGPNLSANEFNNRQMLIVNKKINKMAFYSDGKLVREFKVATGRQPSFTPEGKFPLYNKIKNRPYYSKGIKGGDPKNPLGNRWIGLDTGDTKGTTYAIHGNNNPNSIGTYASAGCIRMYDEEVEWLYDQVELNIPIVIVASNQSFKEIATENGYNLKGEFANETIIAPIPKEIPTIKKEFIYIPKEDVVFFSYPNEEYKVSRQSKKPFIISKQYQDIWFYGHFIDHKNQVWIVMKETNVELELKKDEVRQSFLSLNGFYLNTPPIVYENN